MYGTSRTGRNRPGMKECDWMYTVAMLAVVGVMMSTAFAQTGAAPPAFDVASIKLSDPTKGMLGWLVYPGGRVRIGHASLVNLIEDALDVQSYQVSGGP